MNVADSQRVASTLEQMGYEPSAQVETTDLIVLNTCVVRQSAEDKAYSWLSSLRSLKKNNPNLVINLMGCLVGIKSNDKLKERFPVVDVFSPPSDLSPLRAYLLQKESEALDQGETQHRFAFMDSGFRLPAKDLDHLVAGYIPIVYGCSHACSFCIIPYRRGIERSRPSSEILEEALSMVTQGVREITLLGQIVDRYGKDMPGSPTLASLLRMLNEIEGLVRIRFLTSHPNWLTDELLDAIAELPKVCPHIEVPVQAGDDQVLENMKRNYTTEDYIRLVSKIRQRIPGVSIATDIIVGFPGETEEQFQRTYDLLKELRLDVTHLARYSTRPGTLAARKLTDNVSKEEKMRRFRLLEEMQEKISAEINAGYLGRQVPVLFEQKLKGRWKGRTPTNKLVFVETEKNLHGEVHQVTVNQAGAWSMQAELEN